MHSRTHANVLFAKQGDFFDGFTITNHLGRSSCDRKVQSLFYCNHTHLHYFYREKDSFIAQIRGALRLPCPYN
ncbi:Uncharacterised protein [Vibrio cholerae]|nr:Uncharacterised protein [Vibrio cholerae]